MNVAKAQGIFMRKHRNEALYSAQLISINTKVNDQKKKKLTQAWNLEKQW